MTRLLPLLALASALVLIPASALGADGYDVWQGSAKGGKVSVSLVKPTGSKKVTGSISYQCKLGEVTNSYSTQDLKGTAKGKSVTLKGTAYNGAGTSRIKAKLKKKGAKASVKVSYDYGDEDASTNCAYKLKKVKLKHSFTTGG